MARRGQARRDPFYPEVHRRHGNEIIVQSGLPGIQFTFDERWPMRVWIRHWDGKNEHVQEIESGVLLVVAPRMIRAAILHLEGVEQYGGWKQGVSYDFTEEQ